jgi:molybdopterin synthase catalytic subunit
MKRLTLRLFATLRERARTGELRREFPDGATVGEIWRGLAAEFPDLAGVHGTVAFAVNEEYVEGDFRPRDNDEVAFIPPVSGGSDAHLVGPIRIGREPLDLAAIEASVADPAAGATVTFVGVTRRENAGRKVIRLEYEAYEPMALREMRKIAEEAGRRFAVSRVAISHRIGVVEIGQASVAIAVSAPHRGAAFDACRFAIDRLKEIVPIWKKEHFEGGEVWIGCQTSHPPQK